MAKFASKHPVCRNPGFVASECGSLTVLGLMFFVCMLMIAGISIDMMIFENSRTRLQNLADRASLAAADMQQALKPADIVSSYFQTAGMDQYLDDVQVVDSFAERSVLITASNRQRTMFMNMTGVDELMPKALSQAMEGIGDIEISLVLDVSGSMGWPSSAAGSKSKLHELKSAAKTFVDTVYAGDIPGRITTTVVPYSTQVNAGPAILAQLNATQEHQSSSCVEFEPADFATTQLADTQLLQRAGHFDMWSSMSRNSRWACRIEASNEIRPMLDDPGAIKSRIDALSAEGQTSTDLGLKWGAAFLDPAMRSVMARLNGVAPEDQLRPVDFDGVEASKFVVLLTDGINTTHKKLRPPFLGGGSYLWKYLPQPGEIGFVTTEKTKKKDDLSDPILSVYLPERGDEDGDGISNEPYWVPSIETEDGNEIKAHWVAVPFGQPVYGLPSIDTGPDADVPFNVFQLSWPEVWATMPPKYFAETFIKAARGSSSDYNDFMNKVWTDVTGTEKDSRTQAACDALKAQRVTVFSIGFEVDDHAAEVMEGCASTPNHFIRAVGDDLGDAFNAIATNISTLRLTQ
ncbi:hypothetical protein LCGC14_1936870 [marine sediment metagenome]|uniref:Putative Flp pilus-assembly TadG-like N-terminal domain-containing protein n=1 Tax=marine sediment metagenome TaxID=412755 RepID=A0A0F9IIW4_9ZZZZ